MNTLILFLALILMCDSMPKTEEDGSIEEQIFYEPNVESVKQAHEKAKRFQVHIPRNKRAEGPQTTTIIRETKPILDSTLSSTIKEENIDDRQPPSFVDSAAYKILKLSEYQEEIEPFPHLVKVENVKHKMACHYREYGYITINEFYIRKPSMGPRDRYVEIYYKTSFKNAKGDFMIGTDFLTERDCLSEQQK